MISFETLKRKSQNMVGEVKRKARHVADVTGLGEMADVRHHMPRRSQLQEHKMGKGLRLMRKKKVIR